MMNSQIKLIFNKAKDEAEIENLTVASAWGTGLSSDIIGKATDIARNIDEDLDNSTDPNEIRILFARLLGVQPQDIPMQDERLRQFVGKTREELCDLIFRSFSVETINKIHWTLGLSAHILICCNTLNEKDRLLAQKIATYLVKEKKLAVYFKKSEMSIAVGVEKAKSAIIIASPDFQRNQGCAEEVNYCDQRKVPILTVVNSVKFSPMSWLASILAVHGDSIMREDYPTDNDLLEVISNRLISMIDGSLEQVSLAPTELVDVQLWVPTVATAAPPATELAGLDMNEDKELPALQKDVDKKIQERNSLVLYYCAEESVIALAIEKELKLLSITVIACCVQDVNVGLEIASKALVVCPLMSPALENSPQALKILTYCNLRRLPFVPIKAAGRDYIQAGWLAVITAGLLWTEISNIIEVPHDTLQLQSSVQEFLTPDFNKCDIDIGSGEDVNGYYIYHSTKYAMKFDFLSMKSGHISGQGEDVIGLFVLCGDFDARLTYYFVKQYIGQHSIEYSGSISIEHDQVILTGKWWNGFEGDDTEIRLERVHPPEHVMLSYQWGSQHLVKRVAAFFKSRKLPVWLDIDGGMKGNINQAMANGVEGACVVCSFVTPAYIRSPNCNKEINYAYQLKKRIVLVNVDGVMDYSESEGSPLSKVAAVIDDKSKVILPQPSEEDGEQISLLSKALERLYEVVTAIVEEESAKKAFANSTLAKVAPPADIYQGGWAVGTFMIDSSGEVAAHNFFLNNILIRKGLVSGYGQDNETGETTISGFYDSDNGVSFQMEFEHVYNFPRRYFKGTYTRKGGNGFRISGLCSLTEGHFDDDRLTFVLESPEV